MHKKVFYILLAAIFLVESLISPALVKARVQPFGPGLEQAGTLLPAKSLPSADFKKKYLVMSLCTAIQQNLSLRKKEDLVVLLENAKKISDSLGTVSIDFRRHDGGISEVTVHVPDENIAVRYLDREYARVVTDFDSVKGLKTDVFGEIHRQIIHTEQLQAKQRTPITAKPVFSESSPLLLNETWKNSIESPDLEEIHIVTAGGGGDVVGGAFLALQLKHLMGRDIRVKVFTSNLKRGEENPAGGPLSMTIPGEGKRFRSFPGSEHFYPVSNNLNITTVIKDANQRAIEDPRYRAVIPIREARIVDVLAREGIELVMSDAGESGKNLADDYLSWQEGRSDKIFVIGLDMGGDIFARFPFPIDHDRPDKHPERDIRSPNTDAVFLDMFTELGKNPLFENRMLLGVSALGGDGEMGDTLKQYIRDYYESGDVEGVLDNIRYMAEHDPQGLFTKEIVEECLLSIPTEVSGNFLMRLFSIARVLPLVGEKLKKGALEKTAGWAGEYAARGYSRGMPLDDIFDAEIMASELPAGKVSRGTIRNRTRQEVLPLAYPFTIFLRPGSVSERIADPVMRDTEKTWMEKDRYLRENLFYHTEMSDPNNVSDRELINEYLLKSRIIEVAWSVEDPLKRPLSIKKQLDDLKDAKYVLSPNLEQELNALCALLYEDFDDTLSYIAYLFSSSEKEYQLNKKKLVDWVDKKRKKAQFAREKDVSLYTYSYFVAYNLTDLANFVTDTNELPSMDKFMGIVDASYGAIERIKDISKSNVLCSVIVERILPVIARSSSSDRTFEIKMEALEGFVRNKITGGLKTLGSFHFMFFVMPYILEYEYGEEYRADLGEILNSFTRLAQNLEMMDAKKPSLRYIPFHKIFQNIMPQTLYMFDSHGEIKQFIEILMSKTVKEAVEGRIEPSHLYTLLDMLSHGISSRQIATLDEVRSFLRAVTGLIKKCEKRKLEISSVLVRMMDLSERLKSNDQLMWLIAVFNDKIDVVTEFDTSYTEYGTTHDLPAMVRRQLEEKANRYSGSVLLNSINNLDFNLPTERDVHAQIIEDFRLTEKNVFTAKREKIRKADIGTKEELDLYIKRHNRLKRVKDIRPLSEFDREEYQIARVLESDDKDAAFLELKEKEKAYRKRGESLIEGSRFAYGFTSGLLTRRPSDHMDINLTVQIEDTDGVDRSFVEWKFYVLKKMQQLYETENIPAVIMTGFKTSLLAEQLLRTDNFGYTGPVYLYHQGPTRVMDKRGRSVKIGSEDLFATAGAWGFVKWLVISGKLRQLRRDDVRYLSHSNVNNPAEGVDAGMIGYFDSMVEKARESGSEEPLTLVQLAQRIKRVSPDGREEWERGGAAVEIEYEDGTRERRVVHQDRWPEEHEFLSEAKNNYNLANYIINLDRLWEIFGLDDFEQFYGSPEGADKDLRSLLASRVDEIERQKGITPILRTRDVPDGQRGVFIDYALDDITLLGRWLACQVDRKDHFVSLKGFGDIFQYGNAHVLARKMKQIELDIYRADNPVVDYLMEKNVLHDVSNMTLDEIRKKILRMFLPSRLFRENDDLVEGVHIPGLYVQKEIEGDTETEQGNIRFRDGIVDQEMDLLAGQFRRREAELEEMKAEAKKLWRDVFALDLGGGVRLGEGITNAESNMIVRQCVKIVFFGTAYTPHYNPFASVNRTINDIALRRIRSRAADMSLRELLKESVSSVKIKQYEDIDRVDNDNFEQAYLEIEERIELANKSHEFEDQKNVELLIERMSSGHNTVTYITDDNAEIVYHLYLIQRFLLKNPDLKVILMPRGGQYGVDASYDDAIQLIKSEEIFRPLKTMIEGADNRMDLVKTSPRLGGVDLRRLSPEARDSIMESDFIVSLGCMNYEALSGLKKESFHILMVHGDTSRKAARRSAGTYSVFHYLPGTEYLEHDEDIVKKTVYETANTTGKAQRGVKVFGSAEKELKASSVPDAGVTEGDPDEGDLDKADKDNVIETWSELEENSFDPAPDGASGLIEYLDRISSEMAALRDLFSDPVLIRLPVEALDLVKDRRNLIGFFSKITRGERTNLYFEIFSSKSGRPFSDEEYRRWGIAKRPLPESFKRREKTNTLTLLLVEAYHEGYEFQAEDLSISLGGPEMKLSDTLLSPLALGDDESGIARSIMFGLQMMGFAREISRNPSLVRQKVFKDRLQLEILESFKTTFNITEKHNVDITPEDLIELMTGSVNGVRRAIVKLIRLIPVGPLNTEELKKVYERTAEILKSA